MANKQKSVVVLLVEGPSDDAALSGIIKAIMAPMKIQCHVLHGDATSVENSLFLRKSAKSIISDCVRDCIKLKRLQKNDIILVAHFMDTDGAFVPEDAIFEDRSLEKYQYTTTSITASNRNDILRRNAIKSRRMLELSGLTATYNKIPYQACFFSRNLEHALHGISEHCTDIEKIRLADEFHDKFSGNLPDFIEYISQVPPAVPVDEYRASWNYISAPDALRSLERGSNLHILIKRLMSIRG